MTALRFEWDEEKNRSNQLKHEGISFEIACQVFFDPLHVSISDRIENGEQRWKTLGTVGGLVLILVAHTIVEQEENGNTIEIIEIISARRATRRERRSYEEESN